MKMADDDDDCPSIDNDPLVVCATDAISRAGPMVQLSDMFCWPCCMRTNFNEID